jgi:hypothetical protein
VSERTLEQYASVFKPVARTLQRIHDGNMWDYLLSEQGVAAALEALKPSPSAAALKACP